MEAEKEIVKRKIKAKPKALPPKSKEQGDTVKEITDIISHIEFHKKEEDNELDLSRQSKLVPEDKINDWTIKVFGVGSIGSHVVKTLAKSGFKNIEVYDCDTVDNENISPQAFDFKHIGMNKVDAMKQIVKDSAGTEILINHGTITKESQIALEPNTIYACFFDSFEGRKIIFSLVKEFPVVFVDGRIGKYDMRHYLVDVSNPEYVKEYAETLEATANSDLVCGEKASAPINVQVAGRIVMNMINYISDKDYSRVSILNAMRPKNGIEILESREKKKVKSEPVETEGQDRENYTDTQDRENYVEEEVQPDESGERVPEISEQEISGEI